MHAVYSIMIGSKHTCVYKVPTKHSQPDAISKCKTFNSKLPFLESSNEVSKLQKRFPKMNFWIGIQDPTSSGKKDNWKDVYTGENIGYGGFPCRDHFFILKFLRSDCF